MFFVVVASTSAVRKNWLQRWFVLDFESENLAYFENQSVSYNNYCLFYSVDFVGQYTQ